MLEDILRKAKIAAIVGIAALEFLVFTGATIATGVKAYNDRQEYENENSLSLTIERAIANPVNSYDLLENHFYIDSDLDGVEDMEIYGEDHNRDGRSEVIRIKQFSTLEKPYADVEIKLDSNEEPYETANRLYDAQGIIIQSTYSNIEDESFHDIIFTYNPNGKLKKQINYYSEINKIEYFGFDHQGNKRICMIDNDGDGQNDEYIWYGEDPADSDRKFIAYDHDGDKEIDEKTWIKALKEDSKIPVDFKGSIYIACEEGSENKERDFNADDVIDLREEYRTANEGCGVKKVIVYENKGISFDIGQGPNEYVVSIDLDNDGFSEKSLIFSGIDNLEIIPDNAQNI